MLVSMKTILDDANKNYYGVMAMNSINMEMARAGITAAEEEHSAIIIQFGNGQMTNHAHLEEMVPLIKELADRVHVPVALVQTFMPSRIVLMRDLPMLCLTVPLFPMKKM